MISLNISFYMNEEQVEAMQKRGFRPLVKEALAEGLVDHHKRFMARHFERRAYGLYKGHYPKRKGGDKKPLVVSGSLRRHVLRKKTRAHVTGTSTRATLHLKYGRPGRLTKRKLYHKTLMLMRTKGLSFKDAQREAYRNAGYNQATKAKIQRALDAWHQSEVNAMAKFVRDRIVAKIEDKRKRGKLKRNRRGRFI
jgi:hypothetical protein